MRPLREEDPARDPSTQRLASLLRSAQPEDVSEARKARVYAAILRGRPRHRWSLLLRPATAVVLVLLAAGAAAWFALRTPGPEPAKRAAPPLPPKGEGTPSSPARVSLPAVPPPIEAAPQPPQRKKPPVARTQRTRATPEERPSVVRKEKPPEDP